MTYNMNAAAILHLPTTIVESFFSGLNVVTSSLQQARKKFVHRIPQNPGVLILAPPINPQAFGVAVAKYNTALHTTKFITLWIFFFVCLILVDKYTIEQSDALFGTFQVFLKLKYL